MAYIAQVATRALIFIGADNPDIGMVCFLRVGMCEISNYEITVHEGQKVRKGDQLGMFHFGGSTWCLVLRPEVKARFHLDGLPLGPETNSLLLNTGLATIRTG